MSSNPILEIVKKYNLNHNEGFQLADLILRKVQHDEYGNAEQANALREQMMQHDAAFTGVIDEPLVIGSILAEIEKAIRTHRGLPRISNVQSKD